MVARVNVKLKQKVSKSKIGRGSSIHQGGKLKMKLPLPIKITVSLKQRSTNSNVRQHQSGSIKVASADKKTKET